MRASCAAGAALIILFALFGWGGDRGLGNGGHGTGDGTFGGGIPNGFALATDFASPERKADGAGNGMRDGFHAAANGMDTGFAAVQNALCQGHGPRLGTQAIQARLAQCRCENERRQIQANTAQCRCGTQAAIQANTTRWKTAGVMAMAARAATPVGAKAAASRI